jgi:hypothetical protein
VKDLGGSVTEIMRDLAAEYSADCWKPSDGSGILRDTFCAGPGSTNSARGGNWHDGTAIAASASRIRQFEWDSGYGLRCAHDVAGKPPLGLK